LTNTWFVSFAPYDQPRLAVCIMVENGKAGGTVCAPIAKRIIDEILSIDDHGYAPEVAAVDEAQGNFDFVELVSFDANPTDAFIGDDEAAVGSVAATSVPAPAPKPRSTANQRSKPAPTVRAAPDARGSAKPPAPAQEKKRTATRTGFFKRFKRR
jgi:penicillin-binding protein 2